jgi:hypothetical protein
MCAGPFNRTIHVSPFTDNEMEGGAYRANLRGLDHYRQVGYKGKNKDSLRRNSCIWRDCFMALDGRSTGSTVVRPLTVPISCGHHIWFNSSSTLSAILCIDRIYQVAPKSFWLNDLCLIFAGKLLSADELAKDFESADWITVSWYYSLSGSSTSTFYQYETWHHVRSSFSI